MRAQERDGWYDSHAFERIKTVLRHKFFSLLEGHPVSDEECRALLVSNEGSAKATSSNRSHKLRAGKHNMAKGALRPEDAAVCVHLDPICLTTKKVFLGFAVASYAGTECENISTVALTCCLDLKYNVSAWF